MKLREGYVFTPVCRTFYSQWGHARQGVIHGEGHVWWGGMHGRKGMCGRGEACMAGEVCMVRGGMHGTGAYVQARWPLKQAVRTLLECILV